jgi:hypothetical protein
MATTINGSTGASQIQDNTVSNAKVVDDAIGVAELSATGTASSSTFLRGDNAWETPGGGGLTELVTFATTSGTTITSPTLNFTGYKLIYLVATAVGVAQDTGAGYYITPNGGSAANFVGGYGPSVVMYASWWIDLSNGIGMGIMNTGGAERATAVGSGATRLFVNTGITTSTTSLSFTTEAGATFNNGSFKIYGLK